MWQCGTRLSLNSEELWVGLELFITSTLPRNICELTACPRAKQTPCICFKLTGHWPCLKVVCLWYDSGIISLSMHLSSYMGIFGLVLVMPFAIKTAIWTKIFVSDSVFELGDSIPRSFTDDHLVWIWCALSYLLPASSKNVAKSLSMIYRDAVGSGSK